MGEFPRGAWFYRRIHPYLRPGDLILFSSQSDRRIHDLLVESTPAKISVQPFGIDVSDFRVTADDRKRARRLLGVDDSEVVFLYHGRITADKNVHGLIGAFRRIAAERPSTRLWIAGDWEGQRLGIRERSVRDLPSNRLSKLLIKVVGDENLAKRITFWGGLSKSSIVELLAAADIAINLTLNPDENFGYGVVEAMAAGLPVIGTDWGGLRDTIADGETGYRISTIQTQAGVGLDLWQVVQRSLQLVDNAELRRKMGESAVRRAQHGFTLERFVASLAQVIESQIGTTFQVEWNTAMWSNLGKQLINAPSPSLSLRHQVLRPYATSLQAESLDPNAVCFLASNLFQLKQMHLTSKDPRYPMAGVPLKLNDCEIIRLFEKNHFCSYQFIRAALQRRIAPRLLRNSLSRLLKAGILIQSAHPG